MTTFDREYAELDRLQGVSLHNDTLLYKVLPADFITPKAEGLEWFDVAHRIEPHKEQERPRITEAEEPQMQTAVKVANWAAFGLLVALVIWFFRA